VNEIEQRQDPGLNQGRDFGWVNLLGFLVLLDLIDYFDGNRPQQCIR
jgi:hypothetical protein